MKCIVTKQNADGSFDSVGMRNRALFTGKSEGNLIKRAREFSSGKTIRMEFFADDKFYNHDPRKVLYYTGFPVKEQVHN